jgi:hypothetical protein
MKGMLEMKEAGGRTHLTDRAPTGWPQAIPRPTHETIARRAYEIWQRHSCPQGTAFQDWLAAQAELTSSGHHNRR